MFAHGKTNTSECLIASRWTANRRGMWTVWIRGDGSERGDRDSVDGAERLLAYAVSAVDRDDEIWVLKLDSAVRLVDEAK